MLLINSEGLTLINSRIDRARMCRCCISASDRPVAGASSVGWSALAAYFSKSGTAFLCTLLTRRQRVSVCRRWAP